MFHLEGFPSVQKMREELTQVGYQELRTPGDVEAALQDLKGSAVVFVNSVCGCAGGIARPAAALALQKVKPDHLFTVFAGQDKDATAKAREYFTPYQPSSPSIAILKDGQMVQMIERHQIEGRDPFVVAAELTAAITKAGANAE